MLRFTLFLSFIQSCAWFPFFHLNFIISKLILFLLPCIRLPAKFLGRAISVDVTSNNERFRHVFSRFSPD